MLVPGVGPAGDTWKKRPVADGIGAAFGKQHGCDDPATLMDCLRELPVETVAAPGLHYFSPTVGTPTLPVRPSERLDPGIPLLMGVVADEGASLVAGVHAQKPLDQQAFSGLLRKLAGPKVDEALAAYPVTGPNANRAFADVYGDRAFACPSLETYRRLGDRVWAYEFTEPGAPPLQWTPPAEMRGTASHGSDMSFLFTLTKDNPTLTPPQHELAASMRSSWAAFASDGRAD